MLPSPFTYFDTKLCINLDSRTDRWEEMQRQFLLNEMPSVYRVPATLYDNKFLAFNTSQFNALDIAHNVIKDMALIMEDDCVFKNTMHLHYAVNELPEDWEVLYLGANIIGIDTIKFKPPTRFSSHLFRLNDAWQTHAMVYSKKGLEKISSMFDVNNGYNYDEWLRVNLIPYGNCYIIAPQIAYQAPGYSDLWQTQADYTSLFDRGNELLK